MSYFPLSSPESVGGSTSSIRDFLDFCDRKGLELHRFMVLRHGICCARVIWEPYREEDLHPLYSFSKSFTATAIGFARQEGLLSLDERIIDIFPEDAPADISGNLSRCTIHDLLCMGCGHETEPPCYTPEWRKEFLSHPFLHEPGSFFKYNTAGTTMLAAVIRKKTGLQVTEYLRPRLFDPLGMGEIPCARIGDDLQTEFGGAGMKISFEDMAKFTQFMLQDGVWEGKSLLKDWFFSRAGVKQIETAGDIEGHTKDWALGYGYQCWMCSLDRSFRADGAFGQFGLVFPTLDLAIVINAATEQTQTMLDGVNQILLPAFSGDGCPCPETESRENAPGGSAWVETRSLPVLISCANPLFEAALSGSCYEAVKTGEMSGFRELVGGSGLFDIDRDHSITGIRFLFDEDHLHLYFTEDGESGREAELVAARNRRFAITEIGGYRYASCAKWRNLRTLELEIRRTDALSGVRLTLAFTRDGEGLSFQADDTLMTDGGLGIIDRRLTAFSRVSRPGAAGAGFAAAGISGNNPTAPA